MMRRSALRSATVAAAAIRSPKRILVSGRCEEHLPPNPGSQTFLRTFLNLYQMGNKEAIEKEKARLGDSGSIREAYLHFTYHIQILVDRIKAKELYEAGFQFSTDKAVFVDENRSVSMQLFFQLSSDELSRGYFADISEIHKHGGKIALANKTIIPSLVAVKFPDLEVNFSDGRSLILPISSRQSGVDASDMPIPCASLLCLSFRASSQIYKDLLVDIPYALNQVGPMHEAWASYGEVPVGYTPFNFINFCEAFKTMAESWSIPFLDAFSAGERIQIYEVSFIDSWLLSLGPIRNLLLKMMRKSNNPRRQIVYAFGDHYYFRKKLHILNLLTGYIFLLDKLGRVRWQGFGSATDEELSSLMSCTSLLLDDK